MIECLSGSNDRGSELARGVTLKKNGELQNDVSGPVRTETQTTDRVGPRLAEASRWRVVAPAYPLLVRESLQARMLKTHVLYGRLSTAGKNQGNDFACRRGPRSRR